MIIKLVTIMILILLNYDPKKKKAIILLSLDNAKQDNGLVLLWVVAHKYQLFVESQQR